MAVITRPIKLIHDQGDMKSYLWQLVIASPVIRQTMMADPQTAVSPSLELSTPHWRAPLRVKQLSVALGTSYSLAMDQLYCHLVKLVYYPVITAIYHDIYSPCPTVRVLADTIMVEDQPFASCVHQFWSCYHGEDYSRHHCIHHVLLLMLNQVSHFVCIYRPSKLFCCLSHCLKTDSGQFGC